MKTWTKISLGIASVLLVMIAALTFNMFTGNTYFVALDGSDQAAGTVEKPFKTIQHAVDLVEPGDTIYIREGTYSELVQIHDKGRPFGGWITIRPYEAEQVTIDGQNLEINGSHRAAFTIQNSQKIIIEKFEILNISANSKDLFPAGILILGTGKDIVIRNNHIYQIANYDEVGNAHGILVYGNQVQPIKNVTIQNNELHDLTLGSSESLTLSGNVTGFLIDSNKLYNNNNIGIDIAGHYGACDEDDCLDIARNGTVSNNHVTAISSAENPAYRGDNSAPGIYVDGGEDVVIENNYVAYNDFGISISSENNGKFSQNVTLRHNTIAYNTKAGLVIGGSSKENGGARNTLVEKNEFIHNDVTDDGYLEVTIQQHNQKNIYRANTYYVRDTEHYMHIVDDANSDIKVSKERVLPYSEKQ